MDEVSRYFAGCYFFEEGHWESVECGVWSVECGVWSVENLLPNCSIGCIALSVSIS